MTVLPVWGLNITSSASAVTLTLCPGGQIKEIIHVDLFLVPLGKSVVVEVGLLKRSPMWTLT